MSISCQADPAPEAKGIHILSGKVDFVFPVEAKKCCAKLPVKEYKRPNLVKNYYLSIFFFCTEKIAQLDLKINVCCQWI